MIWCFGDLVFWFSGAALAKAKDETLRGPPPEATASCRPQEDQASPLNLNLGQAPVQDQPQPASALAKPLQSSNALDKSLISYFES